jgi:hypothetical protein
MPQAEAEAGLVDLGEEMRGYAATLERTIDHSRAQMEQLGVEFSERVNVLSAAAEEAIENSSGAGRTLSMHAEALRSTLREAFATLDEIRAASNDQTAAVDAASLRAGENVRELTELIHKQVGSIEAVFQQSVAATLASVSETTAGATQRILAASGQIIKRAEEVGETLARQANAAGIVVSDAGSQAAGAIAQATDEALGRAQTLVVQLDERAIEAGELFAAAADRAGERIDRITAAAAEHADTMTTELAKKVSEGGRRSKPLPTACRARSRKYRSSLRSGRTRPPRRWPGCWGMRPTASKPPLPKRRGAATQ